MEGPVVTPKPAVATTLLVGDDSYLLAELSSALRRPRTYLAVLDGPRMWRVDADIEVTLRQNAIARSQAKAFVLAGLPQSAVTSMQACLPAESSAVVSTWAEAVAHGIVREHAPRMRAARGAIGPALVKALREGRQLEFVDTDPVEVLVPARGRRHLVACEEGNLHAQVVAANYAYAFDADFVLMPAVPEDVSESLLAELYGIYEQRSTSPTEAMRNIASDMRGRAGICIEQATAITFFTAKLPWGFAFAELSSSHVFNYPSTGLTVLNGVVAQDRPVRTALGLDPGKVQAAEITAAARALADRGALVSVRHGPGASVRQASRTIELFPYDLLLISTHCGDADGWRWTYRYPDREGRERTLVVDVAISAAEIPNNENLEVVFYKKFVSLDGVDWADREAKMRLPVGSAMLAYMDHIRADPPLEPVHQEPVARVSGSAALRMFDGNFLVAARSLADTDSPMVINNACASWHELAARFSYANCRHYVGTLFGVSDAEAQEVINRLMTKHVGKPIALALWHVQREVYGDSPRRPYAVMGVYFQSLRTATGKTPSMVATRLRRAHAHWSSRLADPNLTGNARFTISDYVAYLEAEIESLRDWLSAQPVRAGP